MGSQYPGHVSELLESIQTRVEQGVISDAEIFEAHDGGKLAVGLTAPLDTQRALSIAYTPGVAQVSRAIAADHTLAEPLHLGEPAGGRRQ